jgi:hypothetical protein
LSAVAQLNQRELNRSYCGVEAHKNKTAKEVRGENHALNSKDRLPNCARRSCDGLDLNYDGSGGKALSLRL